MDEVQVVPPAAARPLPSYGPWIEVRDHLECHDFDLPPDRDWQHSYTDDDTMYVRWAPIGDSDNEICSDDDFDPPRPKKVRPAFDPVANMARIDQKFAEMEKRAAKNRRKKENQKRNRAAKRRNQGSY
jgi:hypothetical protein